MKKNKGFTLIELLVVIAIIGILASVVLAALSSARSKGADAAIKADLANARAQAELFYSDNGNAYQTGTAATTSTPQVGDVCSSNGLAGSTSGIYKLIDAAGVAYGTAASSTIVNAVETGTLPVCQSAPGTWVAQAPLKSVASTWWCVDSTGASKQEGALLGAAALKCS